MADADHDEELETDSFEPPPIIPNIQDTLEDFISNTSRLRIHQARNNLRLFPTFPSERDIQPLLNFHDSTIPLLQQVKRDPKTGKILSYEEVETESFGECAKNSCSLNRALGPRNEFLRGNSTNYPFWPGGFDKEDLAKSTLDQLNSLSIDSGTEDEANLFHELFEKDLLTSPPGIQEGRQVKGPKTKETDSKPSSFDENVGSLNFWNNKALEPGKVPLSDVKLAQSETRFKRMLESLADTNDKTLQVELDNEDDGESVRVLPISKTPLTQKTQKLPWAEMVDIPQKPIANFDEKVPDMAFKFKFPLDPFQQEAIIRLEEHENVFIAAHTSAGKTAVAEYAIALSSRHMTRTIYTSPIKALSNQKFRDFKENFEPETSVGLVTGDVQINSSAACLIMTTEILRSMLYNGSDVIRDLEWVIFDEIHYLNNEERGHVWEEVIIMLPQHVSIIMLSATVPNALQFANWVGGIKRKKIYVIATQKRPVPLEHFLYTGSGGKSRNEQFLILDKDGKFLKKGYDDAREAKESRKSNHQKQFGAKGKDQQRMSGQRGFNENQEKTTYVGLINHLKKNEDLPVVVFTFSRKRCDDYAQMMSSVEALGLCTGEERGKIRGFFSKSISRLTGSDKELPQVMLVKQMLENGVGVHHSGILPILKEVVEMCFQQGLVKVLFATETFAMGVNMPARTVVFDSTRKHDGTCNRDLNPAEYIQMAGRAGRRGLDKTGTVIILCKTGLPDLHSLQQMMLGSAAKLESQFRLTYSMILNLLRVESLTVEDVMKRSFLEVGKSSNVDQFKENRKIVVQKLEEMETPITSDSELITVCKAIKNYIKLHDTVMDAFAPHLNEILGKGCCILFEDLPKYCPRFGIILTTYVTKDGDQFSRKYEVLALYDPAAENLEPATFAEDYNKIKLTNEQVNRNYRRYAHYYLGGNGIGLPPPSLMTLPEGGSYPYHKIFTIPARQVLEIVDVAAVRTDDTMVRNDIKRREMPRFRTERPTPNVSFLLEVLFNLTGVELTQPNSTRFVDMFLLPIPVKEAALMTKLHSLHQAKVTLRSCPRPALNNFEREFRSIFEYMRLLEAKEEYDYWLSPQSLQLHEEYESRVEVLKRLGYINNECLVQLKGRVACEMGNQNELLVTEMVLNNLLSDCSPEEIAALLSCMVFEAKNVDEPEFTPDAHLGLKVKEIKDTARKIAETQRDCGLREPIEQYVEQFKFGLVEVVHEWAKGEEFRDIMRLTTVQEGIIVRTIQRLDEMIRDVKDAARIIGDPSLKKKMEEASECIKRDIVFAASLYTQ